VRLFAVTGGKDEVLAVGKAVVDGTLFTQGWPAAAYLPTSPPSNPAAAG